MQGTVIVLAILASKATAFVDEINFSSGNLKITNTIQNGEDGASTKHIEAQYFTQELDHFNASVSQRFQQRYFERDQFWKAGGPIFIVIGGEDDTRKGEVFGGITEQLAKETNGALYALEHRYYGVSLPFHLVHAENMKYLNSRQALADLAEFIIHLKDKEKFKYSKVVAIGGSYAGNLAAWMRAKYPNLVDAALASSAPIIAKADFAEYHEAVGDVYRKYGGDICYTNIQSIFAKVRYLFLKKTTTKKINKMINICPDNNIDDKDNQRYLLRLIASSISSDVQYGNAQIVKDQCAKFAQMKEDDKLDLGIEDCINIDYQEYLKSYRLDPWMYQQCTEFGFEQTASSKKQPFYSPEGMKSFYQQCSEILGQPYNKTSIEEAVNRTNVYYGGLDAGVTRVIFTHGSLDPWARLGATETQNTLQTPVIIIEEESHCSDLNDISEEESEYMKINRAHIRFWIKYWLENEDELRTDQQW